MLYIRVIIMVHSFNMQRIEKIIHLLFIAVGRRYEMLAYKEKRDQERAAYNRPILQKPPTLAEQLAEGQSELTKIKKIMHHVSELKKIINEG